MWIVKVGRYANSLAGAHLETVRHYSQPPRVGDRICLTLDYGPATMWRVLSVTRLLSREADTEEDRLDLVEVEEEVTKP